MTLHSQSPPEACKDRITTKTQTAGGVKTSLPEVHTRYMHAPNIRLLEEWQGITTGEKKQWEKQVGKTTWGKKHPILSGVEICHKHIPHPILTLSYFNIGKYCICLYRLDAVPKRHTSVASHNTVVILGNWRGKYEQSTKRRQYLCRIFLWCWCCRSSGVWGTKEHFLLQHWK